MRHSTKLTLAAVLFVGVAALLANQGGPTLVVHEWGTFTSLQDEEGRAIENLSPAEEPLPRWVHDVARSPRPRTDGQAEPRPRVILRLETPVTYFYRGERSDSPLQLDVEVGFRGGWLTQFYPSAECRAPGLEEGSLEPTTIGRLRWRGLRVGTRAAVRETEARVWTAPREVRADTVTTGEGESERYLFYRGVANLEAPLRVVRENAGDRLQLFRASGGSQPGESTIPRYWLVETRLGGSLAFRASGRLTLAPDKGPSVASIPAEFAPSEFREKAVAALRQSMREGLVEAGLYPDEADAMLNTWQASYFESPGLRLFFIVPPQWTEAHLPLSISAPARITRVMVGRIELVTPEQRAILRRISAGLLGDGPLRPGTARYDAYRALGRFRDALLLDEARFRPTPALSRFMARNGIAQPGRLKGLPGF